MKMDKKEFSTFRCRKLAHDRLMRVIKIKRWNVLAFFDFLSELFANSLDMLDNEDVDISVLRKLYGDWALMVLPYGVEKNE